MSLQIRRSIDPTTGPDDLAGYIARVLGPAGPTPGRLTQVIAKTNENIKRAYDTQVVLLTKLANDSLRAADTAEAAGEAPGPKPPVVVHPAVAPGFPWPTLVIGSGCLDERIAIPRRELLARPHELSCHLQAEPVLLDGTVRSELAKSFAWSLLVDRLPVDRAEAHQGPDAKWTGEDQPSVPTSRRTAQFVLATALITRLYHEARALQAEPLQRWDGDVARVPADAQLAAELGVAVTSPALALVDALIVGEPNGPVDDPVEVTNEAVGALLGRIKVGLGRQEVNLTDLRLLTECTWHLLVAGALLYPGWTDLLLWLSLQEGTAPQVTRTGARPMVWDLSASRDRFTDLYERATKQSWDERLATKPPVEGHTPSSEAVASGASFYDTAARVLRDQAALRSWNSISYALPVASAFVTTFDLELEMSLLRTGGSPFVVALPVYVQHSESQTDMLGPVAPTGDPTVTMRWLACLIRPVATGDAAALDALRKPVEWFDLGSRSNFGKDGDAYASYPVVVRLTGCPLIRLPDLDHFTELRSQLDAAGDGEVEQLSHALLLDEYAAMMQTAVERFQEHEELTRTGLPRWITGVPGGENASFARFWLVAGVQVADSPVRHRLVSQLSSPALTTAPPRNPPKRAGLVVNRRPLERAEEQLLRWNDFDVAGATSRELEKELAHYAKHLEYLTACSPDDRCTL